MNVWAVMAQKGGAGKTTMALHLGIAAMHKDDLSVLILDTDPQQSAKQWAGFRPDKDLLRVSVATIAELDWHLKEARKEKVDLVIIDTAPRITSECIEITERADLVIVPAQPSVLDILAIGETLELIKKGGNGRKTVIVLSRVPLNSGEGEEAIEALQGLGTLLKSRFSDRVDFRRSLTSGKGVTELAPKSKAADEVKAVYQEIKGMAASG